MSLGLLAVSSHRRACTRPLRASVCGFAGRLTARGGRVHPLVWTTALFVASLRAPRGGCIGLLAFTSPPSLFRFTEAA